MRPVTTTATVAAPVQLVNLDSWSGAALGVQVNPLGGATFTIDYSFDDPNDLIWPVPLGSMFFDTAAVPSGGIGGSIGLAFSISTAPIWMRLRLLNGVGSVRAVFLQMQDGTVGGGSIALPTVIPVNVVAPQITGPNGTGGATVSQTLNCAPGTWQNRPTSYAYQWKRDGTTNIGTGPSYLLVSADDTHSITCVVTATNGIGNSSPATSNAIAVTTGAGAGIGTGFTLGVTPIG